MLNATTLILGHAHPSIAEAVGGQAAKGTAFSIPTVSQIRLARLLCDRIPSYAHLGASRHSTRTARSSGNPPALAASRRLLVRRTDR